MESSITSFCKVDNIEAVGKVDKPVINNYKTPEFVTVRVREDMIPKGAKLVECYVTENEVIVCGEPGDEEEEKHNCDQMGCSSMSHVIHRFNLEDSMENKYS